MSLINLWNTSENLLTGKSVKQIIAIAGSGKIADGNATSIEFRALLSKVSSGILARYAEECLNEAFPESGLVLQDTINEIGRRLGFDVLDRRYRGKQGDIGNDGLWRRPGEYSIVVEVKTTDAFRIDLNVIANYRNALVENKAIDENTSSILVIVGRADTDDLEAQIRGSRHAWDIRLISIKSLVRLMHLKESVEDPETLRKIHQLLIPREFTKLDGIVDLLFEATEDTKITDEITPPAGPQKTDTKESPKLTPVAFNDVCAKLISEHLGKVLLKRTRAFYSTPDNDVRLICAVSKKYDDSKQGNYWFAFHPHQREELEAGSITFAGFGCGSPAFTILIPGADFIPMLEGMNVTEKDGRMYWHVQISEQENIPVLIRRKGQPKIDLSKYRL